MKYFIDTEFIEGFHKPLFGKKRHFIDLISIGIVCEDGRTYYRISNEYNYNDADDWVKENVITSAYRSVVSGDHKNRFDTNNFHKTFGVSTERIQIELLNFFGCWRDQHFSRVGKDVPEIYGYYADYDWVLFCSLFGRMIDLPKGFPMYCKDLKQDFDDLQMLEKYNLKEQPNYPKQVHEHNALDDAKWNKRLYDFLQSIGRNVQVSDTTGDEQRTSS